jgi:hypothetical protein
MNRTVCIAAALFAFVGAPSVFAESIGPSGDTQYQRYLLDDPSVHRMPASEAAARLIPGPNAQHLIHLGVEPRVAIEQARALGEQPQVARTVSAAELPINGYDMYARNAMAAATAVQDTHWVTR